MKTNKIIYRQGDVIISLIDALPKNLKVIECRDKFVLAEGEATGHKHLLIGEKMRILQDENGGFYLDLKDKAQLTHEEHKTITILPGIYKVGREQEYDYFLQEIRQVND